MRPVTHLFFTLCLFLSWTASSIAAPSSEQSAPQEPVAIQGQIQAVPHDAAPLDPNVFRYGAIQAQDPAVREQIKALYKEQWDLQQTTLGRLREIHEAAGATTDFESRQALSKEGMQLKQSLLRSTMELGLEIARLNEDAQRVADYEKALDQLLHPEKWMPAHTPDPELQARRMRELGITK